jgi:class 3 adenylate cyclase
LTAIKAVRYALKFVFWVMILGFGVTFALQFEHSQDIEAIWLVVSLHGFVDPLMTSVTELFKSFPATIPYLKYLPVALLVVTWMVKSSVDTWLLGMQRKMVKAKKAAAPPPLPMPVNLGGASLQPGARTPGRPMPRLTALPPESERTRQELLRKYREIEQAVKSAPKKHCTFLSIDVVRPSQMKAGADDTAVTLSFRAYEDLVRAALDEYSVWKQAWTADGALSCFLSHDLAVAAAQRILQSLEDFNSTANRLNAPFRVRCGATEGEVALYEDTPLERLVEHTMDLAGHLQKAAQPNTLWLTADLYEKLPDQNGFRATEEEVQGRKIYEWSPRPARPVTATATGTMGAMATAGGVGSGGAGAVAAIGVEPGGRVGRYEIIDELGRGAMGAVFKARDPQLGRIVAIKVILTANLSPDDLRQYKQRFYREAQAAGQMSHPGIITIHDVAEDDVGGQPYLVMEFVEGTTLDDILKSGKAKEMTVTQMLDIAAQVADALDYAHRRGVVHRDIKPSNILLTPDAKAKIADFGVAKLAGTEITQTGQLVGTPAFMSPEQLTGDPVDARSDLFSFGAVLYYTFTGEKPFPGDTVTSVIYKVIQTAPTPARKLNPKLPPEVDIILARLLNKNADQRYPNGRALAADLEAVKNGRPLAEAPPQPA